MAYVGPGDLGIPFTAFWSFRAYSAATRGNNAVRLRRDSDNAEQDFATGTDGRLNAAAIAAFKGAANLFIVTFYDQTGNGYHAVTFDVTKEVLFTANVINGMGVYDNTSATNGVSYYTAPISTTIRDTYSHSFMGFYKITTGTAFQLVCGFLNDEIALVADDDFPPPINKISVKNEGNVPVNKLDVTATDNVWNAVIGTCDQNGNASFVIANTGAATTGIIDGNPSATGTGICIFGDNGSGPTSRNSIKGYAAEAGWYAVAQPSLPWTQAQAAAIISNSRIFWGLDPAPPVTFSNGLYWVVTTSSVAPTSAQIVAGEDHNGDPAVTAGAQEVIADGIQNILATGIARGTYYAHFFQRNRLLHFDSNIVSTSSFAVVVVGGSLDFSIKTNSMYLGGPS